MLRGLMAGSVLLDQLANAFDFIKWLPAFRENRLNAANLLKQAVHVDGVYQNISVIIF